VWLVVCLISGHKALHYRLSNFRTFLAQKAWLRGERYIRYAPCLLALLSFGVLLLAGLIVLWAFLCLEYMDGEHNSTVAISTLMLCLACTIALFTVLNLRAVEWDVKAAHLTLLGAASLLLMGYQIWMVFRGSLEGHGDPCFPSQKATH
jgi:hypothetical protein